jgi:hypothetical protein
MTRFIPLHAHSLRKSTPGKELIYSPLGCEKKFGGGGGS